MNVWSAFMILQRLVQVLKYYLVQLIRKMLQSYSNFNGLRCRRCAVFPFSESSSLMFAKASQLPALLDSEKQKSEEERKQLIKDKSARERQFRQYYQVCCNYSTSSVVGDNMFNCVIFNDLISNISSYYFNNRP